MHSNVPDKVYVRYALPASQDAYLLGMYLNK